jgi:hypothetical protein
MAMCELISSLNSSKIKQVAVSGGVFAVSAIIFC